MKKSNFPQLSTAAFFNQVGMVAFHYQKDLYFSVMNLLPPILCTAFLLFALGVCFLLTVMLGPITNIKKPHARAALSLTSWGRCEHEG